MPEFHIHVNAERVAPSVERYLKSLDFTRKDFAGHPDRQVGHEPANHLTRKSFSSKEFNRIFRHVARHFETVGGITGYVEGEFLHRRDVIPEAEFDDAILVPFTITTGPQKVFRKSEIHVTLNNTSSDLRVLYRLTDMGLFSSLLPKHGYLAQVFTVQGTREEITLLYSLLRSYLGRAGGASGCVISEERTARSWISSNDIELPPRIQRIDFCSEG